MHRDLSYRKYARMHIYSHNQHIQHELHIDISQIKQLYVHKNKHI